jgi:alkyl hydroperoxide reductase subunit AhpC
MIPREKALVERLKTEPFALVGINTDSDLEQFKQQCKKQGIVWRSSFQGSTGGPLCKAWGIHAFPTIFVLDAKGVVRFVNVREDALDRAVDKLLAEMKSSSGQR